ncbi:MAG: hypothetical protein Q9160_004918 [Pyrenula sp. 1 TL-2023]
MTTSPSPITSSPSRPTPSIVPIPRNGVNYRNKIVLAPMVRSGELPCRLLALSYGADLVWGPETVDRSMIGTTRRVNPRTGCIEWSRSSSNGGRKDMPVKENVLYRIDPIREKGKLIFQVGTASPDLAVQAAKIVASDVSGIDVNAGCPKPFSTTGGMGAALLRTPDHLASILKALVEQVGNVWEIGISVKIRLLETPELTKELVTKLCATGIIGLTIHCRTTPMRPRERAIREQLKMIGDLCREAGVACVMNGDVKNRDEAEQLITEFGVDGSMLATAAEANGSAFRSSKEGGLAPWREVVERHVRFAMEVENKFGNTKFTLSQLIPGKAPAHKPVTMSKTYTECIRILGFEDTMERAQELDQILGLDQQQQKAKKKNKATPKLSEDSSSNPPPRKRPRTDQDTRSRAVEPHESPEMPQQMAISV